MAAGRSPRKKFDDFWKQVLILNFLEVGGFRVIPDMIKLLERCHGGTRWAHGYGAQSTWEWLRDTRRWRRTLNDR